MNNEQGIHGRLKTLHSMLNDAKEELKYYKKYRNENLLLQAGEKTWNASYQLIMINQMKKNHLKPKSHKQNILFMKNLNLNRDTIKKFQRITSRLHSNFYTGKMSYFQLKKDIEYIEKIIFYHLKNN